MKTIAKITSAFALSFALAGQAAAQTTTTGDEYFFVPDTTVDSEGCTKDGYKVEISARILANKTAMEREKLTDLPVRLYRRAVQGLFGDGAALSTRNDFIRNGQPALPVNIQSNISAYVQKMKDETGVLMHYRPDTIKISAAPDPSCRP